MPTLSVTRKEDGWHLSNIISCERDNNERGCQGAGVLEEVLRHLTDGHRNGKGLYLSEVLWL